MEIPGSRGEAHLVEKCKLCNRLNTLTIVKNSFKPYSIEKNGEYQSLVRFDCRGVEPIDFDPRMGWQAEGPESNAVFEDIDLSEKEWSDYDEKIQEPTEINEISVQFNIVKEKK